MNKDRLCWNDYNMLQALTIASRSPDPNTQVGSYICTQGNKPVASGYNGLPRGMAPQSIPWARQAHDPLDTKYPYIAHAEKNAISNATGPLEGAKLFVTLHPCNTCAIDIAQAGITDIWYLENPYEDLWQTKAAVRILTSADIRVKRFRWQNKELVEKRLRKLLLLLNQGEQK